MSDINSAAATRATPLSPRTSLYDSPASSSDATDHRSPSPAGRDSKKRRLDICFPENNHPLNNERHATDTIYGHGIFRPSYSVPHLPLVLELRRHFEPQPRTFLDEDREFMSHIISTRGIRNRTIGFGGLLDRLPGFRRIQEHLPVISTDNMCIIGWREKADTWPMDKARHVQRSFTFPN